MPDAVQEWHAEDVIFEAFWMISSTFCTKKKLAKSCLKDAPQRRGYTRSLPMGPIDGRKMPFRMRPASESRQGYPLLSRTVGISSHMDGYADADVNTRPTARSTPVGRNGAARVRSASVSSISIVRPASGPRPLPFLPLLSSSRTAYSRRRRSPAPRSPAHRAAAPAAAGGPAASPADSTRTASRAAPTRPSPPALRPYGRPRAAPRGSRAPRRTALRPQAALSPYCTAGCPARRRPPPRGRAAAAATAASVLPATVVALARGGPQPPPQAPPRCRTSLASPTLVGYWARASSPSCRS
eukprot:gene25343-biopygen6001